MKQTARTLIDRTLIPHSAFQYATERLEQCFNYAADSAEPICVAVIGESRTGKSRALEECLSNHPSTRDADGLIMPILRVRTPAKPTVKGVAEAMLRALEDPRFASDGEIAKTARLITLMKKCGTRLVMIDEFHHFYDKGTHKIMHYAADWLKTVVDESHVALAVAALPSCRVVLNQNEQLRGRFQAPVVMPRFDWTRDEHREEFIGILGAYHQALAEEFDVPALDSDELAFRCYCATGGLMGYLSKLLRQAVWNALDRETRVITLDDLAEAQSASMWGQDPCSDGLSGSPFSKAFRCEPSPEVLAWVGRIGLPQFDEGSERPKRSRRKLSTESVSDVLTAR